MNERRQVTTTLLPKGTLPTERNMRTTRLAPANRTASSCKRRFLVLSTLVLLGLLTLLWWLEPDRSISTNTGAALQTTLLKKKKLAQDENDDPKEKKKLPHQARYLSYLPHSGFHNQRIALENALTLAKVLNRTLLIPPCLLGTAIPWIEFDKLVLRLRTISSTSGLDHCYHYSEDQQMMAAAAAVSSRECLGLPHGTWVNWKDIINMEDITKSVSLLERESFEQDWLYKRLEISTDQMHQIIKEGTIYQYQYLIRPTTTARKKLAGFKKVELGKFESVMDVYQELGRSEAKVIELGSLFGTSRLKILKDPVARQARSDFRRAMVFHNPVLANLSKHIASQLSTQSSGPTHGYLAVHVRVGDNLFRSHASTTVSTILHNMVTHQLKLPLSSLHEAIHESELEPPQPQSKLVVGNKYSGPCRRRKHTKSHLSQFNRPLFLATDSPLPEVDPALQTIFKLFPCTYLLNDFELASLNHIRLSQEHDELEVNHSPIGKLMLPFLDAMVAARATAFVGTPGSTFSDFVQNVLFQTYHNLSIVEFG